MYDNGFLSACIFAGISFTTKEHKGLHKGTQRNFAKPFVLKIRESDFFFP